MFKIIIMYVLLFVFIIGCFSFLIKSCDDSIENAGGLRGIIVETGKEVKSIYKEINEDQQ